MAGKWGSLQKFKTSTATCSTQAARFVFDYFIKDHLGNTRAVLTEQQESICYPGATLETSTLPSEKQLFTIEDARIRDKSVVNGASSYSQFGDKLYQVHGGLTNQKTGLGIVLKVMAGDKVKFNVQSIYTLPSGGNTGSPLTLGLTDLLSSLAGSSFSGGKGITQNILETLNPIGTFSTFNSKRSGNTTRPQAYLNYMCFNEQFEFTGDGDVAPVGSGSGTTPVYTQINKFVNDEVLINKNGYIYIFVSNESNLPVFFDNLMVTDTPGPIVEETHYYPFGLTMAGISSRAMGKLENKRKYQSYEQNSDFDLNTYETFYRMHDPQIGRWWQIDPKPESAIQFSPYVSMNNNPISLTDPLGDVVKYDKEDAVSKKELRQFRREIREMRRNSDSFSKMYKDMRKSKDVFVYKASASVKGGNTAKPWDKGQNGVTTMSVNVRMSANKVLQTTAHETGHGWRIGQGLDVEPKTQTLPSMPGVLGTSQDWQNYNRQNDEIKGQDLLSITQSREQAEVGAMHISNIVVSELQRSGNGKYSNLELESSYFGPTAIPARSGFGNPTYRLDYKDYLNKVSLDYYQKVLDIYQEHGVNPID